MQQPYPPLPLCQSAFAVSLVRELHLSPGTVDDCHKLQFEYRSSYRITPGTGVVSDCEGVTIGVLMCKVGSTYNYCKYGQTRSSMQKYAALPWQRWIVYVKANGEF
ncbi:hypothetical protein J6590_024150 [Homalodisca vitripennis]|nr:hypothetical protein J6590_024150 [Homalodisca vitripennis]